MFFYWEDFCLVMYVIYVSVLMWLSTPLLSDIDCDWAMLS